MCSPILHLPSYKEPPECVPRYPVQGPKCMPCGMDPVTVRRPLIVHDSTFDYRPTSWPGMLLNNQDKKVRFQLINYEQSITKDKLTMCKRMGVMNQLQNIMSAIQCGCTGCPSPCCAPHGSPPCCNGAGSLVTVYNAILAVGQPPQPIAAFEKATIAIGHHGPNCITTY